MKKSHFEAILGLVLLGVVSRLIPHPPNFTALNSIALLSAFHLKDLKSAFLTLFLTLILSDITLQLHSTMLYVYLSFGLIAFLGYKLQSTKWLPACVVGSSLLFFFISNFGVWFTTSLYPHTVQGLALCYLAAIPFFMHQLAGDLFYSMLIMQILNIAFQKERAESLI